MKPQDQSVQNSGQPNLSHRLTDSDMSCPIALVDNVINTTDKAVAILKLLILGIDTTGHQETDGIMYNALTTAIDLLGDVDAIVKAYAKEVGGVQ